MIRDITIGQYYPAKSILHRLDPRVKVVSTLLYLDFIIPVSGVFQDTSLRPHFLVHGSTSVKSTVWLYCERSEADYHDSDVDGIISACS